MNLPNVFKFYHHTDNDHEVLYTAEREDNEYIITWDPKPGSSGHAVYGIERAKKYVNEKSWLVVEAKNNKEALHFLKKD